jgi:hypothetical protein
MACPATTPLLRGRTQSIKLLLMLQHLSTFFMHILPLMVGRSPDPLSSLCIYAGVLEPCSCKPGYEYTYKLLSLPCLELRPWLFPHALQLDSFSTRCVRKAALLSAATKRASCFDYAIRVALKYSFELSRLLPRLPCLLPRPVASRALNAA